MSNSNHTREPAAEAPETRRREEAQQYVEQLRVFYIHGAVAAVGLVIIFVVSLVTNAAVGITGYWWAWWSVWALIGWGLAVAIHGLVVRLVPPGNARSGWERRQIDRVLSEGAEPLR